MGFPYSSISKDSACNAGDLGSIPGSVRSSGEGNGNPLRNFGLENPMDRGAWQATVHGIHNLATKPPAHYLGLVWVCMLSSSVLSDPLWPHGLKPTRLLYGIFQVRILEWVVISSSRGSSWSRDWIRISCIFCIGRQIITEPPGLGKCINAYLVCKSINLWIFWGLFSIVDAFWFNNSSS